jgi:catechol 2,3-dioxygenase
MSTDAHTPAAAGTSIDPATSLGTVSLTVSDAARMRTFYEDVLGLTGQAHDDGRVSLGDAGGHALVTLHEDRDAPPFDPSGNGLFHLALLVPDRPELGRSLLRIASARWPLTGASDHLVSEALYLRDPEGNGIEVYRDRPRADWPTDRHGELQMATLPLDLDDIVAELGAGEPDLAAPVADGTRMGHVHLQVADVRAAEGFYSDVLGFEPTVRSYPGALFASAGGYHHHIGLNSWQSRGAAPVPPGGLGLRTFEVVLPDDAALQQVVARIREAGLDVAEPDDAPGSVVVRDPFGIAVTLRAA